jgi:hypothetical protein
MAVVITRREFFLGWIAQERPVGIEVEVIEVFSASEGPSAVLIHHASEAGRNRFAEWLRANDGERIIFRLRNGTTVDGRIFRVKMCFGRGLILTSTPVATRAKDRASIN